MLTRIRSFFQLLREPMYANAYALVANQGISAALGLIYWPLASRVYGESAYGTAAAVISVILLISAISQLGLGGGMNRFVPRAGEGARKLVGLAYLVVIAASAVLGWVFVAAADVFRIRNLLGSGWVVWVWVIAASMGWSIFRLQDQVLIGLRQAKWVLIENTIFNVGKLALLPALVVVMGAGGMVGSWFLPLPVVLLLVTWLIFGVYTRPGRLAPVPEGDVAPTLREVMGTSGWDHVGALSSEAASRLLPILIVGVLGQVQDAAFYSVWVIASTLSLVAGAMCDAFTAQAASDRAHVGRHSIDIVKHMAALMLPLALALGLGAQLLVGLFGHLTQAVEAVQLLQLLCLSAPLILFNTWYLAFARVMGRIAQAVAVQVLGAALLLGGSYALLGSTGILGPGWAWLGSQAVIALIGAIDARVAFSAMRPAMEVVA